MNLGLNSRIRGFLRDVFDAVFGCVGYVWVTVFGTRSQVVLAYHSISLSPWIHAVSPDAFRAQLDWLQKKATVVPLSQISFGSAKQRLHRLPIALTFDDGYTDWVTNALPCLEEKHMSATFFVTTSFQSVTSEPQQNLFPLKPEGVTRLAEAGQEIGSHSQTHADFSKISLEQVRDECTVSRKTLQDLSGQPVIRLSYPKSRFRSEIFSVLQETGYQMACAGRGIVRSDSLPFAIPRIAVTKRLTGWRFWARVYGEVIFSR